MSKNTTSVYEKVGGLATVRKLVDVLYEKILADGNMRQFFEGADMTRLKAHQVRFTKLALGGGNEYTGKQMIQAHQHLKGLQMRHFDSVCFYLKETLKEFNVTDEDIEQIMQTVESLRPQFEEAVRLANKAKSDAAPKTLYEEIGGTDAIKTAVDLLYERLLSDGNLRQFFEETDMRKLKAHQNQFVKAALGGTGNYSGRSMVKAHQNLKGLQMSHFDAVVAHLKDVLKELKVDEAIIGKVSNTVGSLRPEFEQAVLLANAAA